MEIFTKIYKTLTTDSPIILAGVIVLYNIIWTILQMKITKRLLNIEVTKKERTIWFFMSVIILSIFKLLIPSHIYKIVNLVIFPIIMTLVLKIDIVKCIVVQLVDCMIVFLIESMCTKNLSNFMGLDNYFEGMYIPVYRIIMGGTVLVVEYIIYQILKWKNIVVEFPENLEGKRKAIIILTSLIGSIVVTMKFIELMTHNDKFHYMTFSIDTIFIIIAFISSLQHIITVSIAEKEKVEIEKLELYNQNLNQLYDGVRAFRHDFGNIVQAMGGYINTENTVALKAMYKDLLVDCQENKELEVLNPEIINNPAIYNIISHKYQKAQSENIRMDIEILADLNKIKIKTYEFSRMLGILLDNAIDAAKKGKEKTIEIKIMHEMKNNRNIVIVKNTYDNRKIDLDKLFEKGYTTKSGEEAEESHGLGLWEIRKILNKNHNLNLFTTIEGKFFKQQLEIYET